MKSKICVSISAANIQKLERLARRAEQLFADLIEVRLDKLHSYRGLSKVVRAAKRPLIATNRPISEKGSFGGSEDYRLNVLAEAVDEGFEYVDLEFATRNLGKSISTLRRKGALLILSHHDHFRTPNLTKLQRIHSQLQRYKPNVSKIVTTARSPKDNLTILTLLQNYSSNPPMVGFAMGTLGVWSRVISPFYGSAFTYASLQRGLETAPGQPAISDLRRIYETLGLE